jgi:pimeloyl-ACP methyl ester carboxylesterase
MQKATLKGLNALSLALALLLVSDAGAQESPQDAKPDWAALALVRLPSLSLCERPGAPEPLLCGSLEVWEDTAAREGRTIELSIVVVPAQVHEPPADPVFIFEGGPGGAVTKRAIGSIYSGPVRARDIVLVDQRGTGDSHQIQCDLGGGEAPEPGKLRQMFPPADVRACAEQLAANSDVALYGSAQLADDIEAVRVALGYHQLNLRGGSYGTRAMMVYAQRYPDNVRTMFGIGVDSPIRSNMSERGVFADRVLGDLGTMCREDATCAAKVPDLFAMTRDLLASLDQKPRRVEFADPTIPGETLSLEIGREWLAEKIRLNLYFAFTSQAYPWAIHRASAGDWQPLAQLAVFIERMFRSSISYGVLLTIQCSEAMDFDFDQARARGNATLFGNYRMEQQIQGCSAWPHEQQDPLGVASPRALPIPTLFLSGALDPVTPPEYADEAQALFPKSHHIVLPEGQHGPFDLANSWVCVHQVWADLLDKGSADDLDLGCVDTMTRPPFLLDQTAFDAHLSGVLAPMVQ